MLPQQIADGLFYWTAPHPDWEPAEDWDEQVGCTLLDAGEPLVLFDPLIPAGQRAEFLQWLDERVAGRPVSILTTIRYHRRDRAELAARYRIDGGRAWNYVPPFVRALALRGAGERMYWLAAERTLVAGDRLLGVDGVSLELCPDAWLQDERTDRRGLAELLTPLLDLQIERVLTSHGPPVLKGGHGALARAIESASAR